MSRTCPRLRSGSELAKVVTWDAVTALVITDGPSAEFKEMLAGYAVALRVARALPELQ
jgi:hypothetical protein